MAGTAVLLLAVPPRGRPAAWIPLFLPFFLPLGTPPPERPWGLLLAVGHGQCLVLELPGLGVVVHDAGSLLSPRGTARKLIRLLRKRGRRRIDLLVLSHADRDHVSALPWILGSFPVDGIILPEHPKSRALAEKLERSGLRPRLLPQGTVRALSLWKGRLLLALPGGPGPEEEPAGPGRANERGMVVHVRLPGWSLLSPGDLSGPAWNRILAFPREFRASLLVAPHHGARTGMEEALVRALRPRVVLASRSWTQGPPPAESLYRRLRVPLLWTGRAGPILLEGLSPSGSGLGEPTSSPPAPRVP